MRMPSRRRSWPFPACWALASSSAWPTSPSSGTSTSTSWRRRNAADAPYQPEAPARGEDDPRWRFGLVGRPEPEEPTPVQLGMIGLGRMGGNMVRRLLKAGHACGVFDLNQDSVEQLASEGAIGTASLQAFVARLAKPRIAWLMVPHEETQKTVDILAPL